MRILIASPALDDIGGVQTYERDLACWLLDRGHSPVVYSTALGKAARHLDRLAVPVTDNLASVGFVPDIIHGDGVTETMVALLHFTATPAIFVCHGWDILVAPAFPRILRYVAVDDTCADRLMTREGHSPEDVSVLLNAVNLDRFRQRAPLPPRPSRAIVFSNTAHEVTHLPFVREACESLSIDVDVVGELSGTALVDPESLLGRYDLAFAKAKAAMEAMACGLAVVLCDSHGTGGMVRSTNLDRLRRLNFGRRALKCPHSVATLRDEIASYDAADALIVSNRIRQIASTDILNESLFAIYESVIEKHACVATGSDWKAESRAIAAFLHRKAMAEQQHRGANMELIQAANHLMRIPVIGPAARSLVRWLKHRR